jgi:predicted PhzF superfamily epimerase YddE/YHI9
MPLAIRQVDAFTDRAFAGNPAAVCVLDAPREAAWMQAVANEMNLSETAFLWREGEGWKLRWFTPTVEVDLCGHATLASAHVLFREEREPGPLRFSTRSGELVADRAGEWLELDFPALESEPAEAPAGLAEALGAPPQAVFRSRFDLLAEFGSERDVRALEVDIGRLKRVEARGVIATARAHGDEFDFVSRFFAPRAGVDEDPVTGSAHCALAPFWGARLGKREMTGYQASARGGVVRVRLCGDRVVLSGRAVTVMRGELTA